MLVLLRAKEKAPEAAGRPVPPVPRSAQPSDYRAGATHHAKPQADPEQAHIYTGP